LAAWPTRERAKEQVYQQAIIALLRTACAEQRITLPVASQPVKPAVLPALPLQAQQLPAPQWCLLTCSRALTSERVIWLQLLKKPKPGGLTCEKAYESIGVH
jgi:hypothetical protein